MSTSPSPRLPTPLLPPNSYSRSAAARLLALESRLQGDRVSLATLFDALGQSAFGMVLILLGLCSVIPLPGLPTGFLFGPVIALVAFQLMRGERRLWLPAWLGRKTISKSVIVAVARRASPFIIKAERWMRPRHKRLSNRLARIVFSGVIFLAAIFIILPIPLGNMLPALSVIAFAFGLILRDGIAVIAGLAFFGATIAWYGALLLFGVELIQLLVGFSGSI